MPARSTSAGPTTDWRPEPLPHDIPTTGTNITFTAQPDPFEEIRPLISENLDPIDAAALYHMCGRDLEGAMALLAMAEFCDDGVFDYFSDDEAFDEAVKRIREFIDKMRGKK
jgi:hypothetical protein